MNNLNLIFIVTVVASILSCSSGKNAYQSGDYYNAVRKSVNRLKNRPNNKKAKEVLNNSYTFAVEKYTRIATQALSSNDLFKYKNAFTAYSIIDDMFELIQSSPSAKNIIVNPINVFDKIDELRPLAAEESYNIGMELLLRGDRISAKKAYFNFQDVNSFVFNYKEVNEKMKEALFVATLKVLVEEIQVPTRYQLNVKFFQDQIQEYLNSGYSNNNFVRFYTKQEVESLKLPYIDQYLRIEFDDFVVGTTLLEKETTNITRDSVVVGTYEHEDGTIHDVYNTVNADLTIFKKQVVSGGQLALRIYDSNSNSILSHKRFSGEFVWFSEWGTFKGDERALTENELELCNQYEISPPPPQTLFNEFIKPIYSQLTQYLDDFYVNY